MMIPETDVNKCLVVLSFVAYQGFKKVRPEKKNNKIQNIKVSNLIT